MHFTPPFIFCIWISACLGVEFCLGYETNYEDVRNDFHFCHPNDSCEERNSTSFRNVNDYPCDCDEDCSKFGTCCIDAPHRDESPAIYQCNDEIRFNTDESYSYYMVPKCPDNTESNSIWKSLCEEERSGTKDIFDVTPVTSLDTGTTYKNYYCFRCHEATDKVLYWNVSLFGIYRKRDSGSSNLNSEFVSVAYNATNSKWLATIHETDISLPVRLTFIVPQEVPHTAIECLSRLVSDCSDSWVDQAVRDKCKAYTAFVYRRFEIYKNVHCALCNFITLDDVTCNRPVYDVGGGGYLGNEYSIFQRVLDYRMYEKSWCMENQVKERATGNCKKLSCAIPGYILKNGTCTPP